MKKLVAAATVAVMSAALFAGCGGSDSSASTAASSTAASSAKSEAKEEGGNYKIALCHQHISNSFHVAVEEGADAKAAELGVTVVHLDAEQNAEQQISQIEQCISEGYDAIIFEPVDPDGMVDTAKKVAEAGIPVINFSSTVTGWEEFVNGYAGASNTEAGEVEMQHVADMIGGKGDIAILTGPQGDSGGLLRYAGYENILKNYPDIHIVVEAAADWDTSKGQATAESWLTAYDLAAIVCENDGMAVGAGNAAGANSGIVITGVDASEDGLEAIADGRQTGTVAQDAATQGGLAIQMAYDFITGKLSGVGNSVVCENIWVDAENLEDYKAGKLN